MHQKKVCVITGGNAGIGKATAIEIARAGLHLVLVCRNRERAEQARRDICSLSAPNPESGVSVVIADLSRPDHIRRAAREIAERFPMVHILVNNAGAIFGQRELTPEGFEKTIATNHFSYFLMSHYLLPQLRQAARSSGACSRIVNLASDAHRQITKPLYDWQSENNYSGFRAYSLSKMANILFTREWARRNPTEQIVMNAVHPGVIKTDIGTRPGGLIGFIWQLMMPFMGTPEKGARTSVFLALDPSADRASGGYFVGCRLTQPSRIAQNPDYGATLWHDTERLLAPWLPALSNDDDSLSG